MNGQESRTDRLYFLGKLRRVQEWQALSCRSDEAALAQAASLIEDHIAVEVVEGCRIVGTILAANVGPTLGGNGKPGLCCR